MQYFEEGYALHAAYWHDDFGTPRSHGCINLAPEDAQVALPVDRAPAARAAGTGCGRP